MKNAIHTFTLAAAVALVPALAASAADNKTSTTGNSQSVKVSKSECDALWQKAAPKSDKLPEGEAHNFITDMKQVDINADGSLDKAEFLQACDKGLINQAAIDSKASTGASSGTAGASDSSGSSSPSRKEEMGR